MSRSRHVDPLVEMDKAREAMEREEQGIETLLKWPRASLTTDEQRDRHAGHQVPCSTCRAPAGKPCRSGRGIVKPCAMHAPRRAAAAAVRARERMGGPLL